MGLLGEVMGDEWWPVTDELTTSLYGTSWLIGGGRLLI